MRINTVEEALAILKEVQNENLSVLDGGITEFSQDFVLRVEIPYPPINSSMNAPYMEAFLELQKQIYQLAALQKTGVANVGFLSEDEKRTFDISVVVESGSSVFTVQIPEALEKIANEMVNRMTGEQIAAVIISGIVMLGSAWAFKMWLNHKSTIKLEELRNTDRQSILEAMGGVDTRDKEKYDLLVSLLEKNGDMGKKTLEAVDKSYDAFIKATAKTDEAVINGTHLTSQEAKALRATARARAAEETIIRKVRVVDINTSNPARIIMTLIDEETDDQYKLSFADRLLDTDAARKKIFDALNNREPIFVEMLAKIHDGDIRSVELKKVIEE